MDIRRGLLTQGNQKLGEAIHIWSLPAVETCPGRSDTCTNWCYARTGRYLLDAVRGRLRWNLEQALKPDFAQQMGAEVRRKGCLVVRVHGSGDFFSAAYAECWMRIISACPNTKFYCYTRSHVVPDILPMLAKMAEFDNARVWFSSDADLPPPAVLPVGVRTCFLQTAEDEVLPPVDLVFRVRRLRKQRVPLGTVCPSERPKGQEREIVCGSCTKCFR